MENKIVFIHPDGRESKLGFEPGLTLAQAVFLSPEVGPRPLCSGLGRCGRCKLRFTDLPPEPNPREREVLGAEDLARGVRLACSRPAEPGMRVCLVKGDRGVSRVVRTGPKPVVQNLAVDLGTTSLHWLALGPQGEEVFSGAELNPQLGAGSEVMSRLAFASTPAGKDKLRNLVLDRLRSLVSGFEWSASSGGICVAGNSVMTYILLGLELGGLSRAPYNIDFRGGEDVDLGSGLGPAYIPPLIAPFVGGDVSAGLAWLRLGRNEKPKYPFMLADLGTNGEFILAAGPEDHLAASAPMGPALEGVGLSSGDLAGPGSIVSFDVGPKGLVPEILGPGRARSLSGTGCLSLINLLRRFGFIDRAGLFADPASASGLAGIIGQGFETSAGKKIFRPAPGLSLCGGDVEEVLKVKAAFNLAFSRLLAEAGLGPNQLEAVYLAGAMGEHVDPNDLAGLGFIPQGLASKVRPVGNSSLAGAALFLEQPWTREWAGKTAQEVHVVELAGDSSFGRDFISRMVFDHVD